MPHVPGLLFCDIQQLSLESLPQHTPFNLPDILFELVLIGGRFASSIRRSIWHGSTPCVSGCSALKGWDEWSKPALECT